jgi:hypothetical protein
VQQVRVVLRTFALMLLDSGMRAPLVATMAQLTLRSTSWSGARGDAAGFICDRDNHKKLR